MSSSSSSGAAAVPVRTTLIDITNCIGCRACQVACKQWNERPGEETELEAQLGFQNPATQLSGVTGSVFEEVALGPMNLGLPARETVERAKTALATLRIEALAERAPRRLSGGQAQLVVIASLLAMRPAHLVLDEPTAQLDPEGTRLVAEALRDLAATGTALLVVEHKTDLLDGLCDRIVVLDGGRLVASGPTAEVLADPRLEEWGVEPPSRVRIARALDGAGIAPARAAEALAAVAR